MTQNSDFTGRYFAFMRSRWYALAVFLAAGVIILAGLLVFGVVLLAALIVLPVAVAVAWIYFRFFKKEDEVVRVTIRERRTFEDSVIDAEPEKDD